MMAARISKHPGVEWQESAKCQEYPPDLFFPKDGVGVEDAKKICMRCVVRLECLEFALYTKQDHGVWGGTSERERRRILFSRRRAWNAQNG